MNRRSLVLAVLSLSTLVGACSATPGDLPTSAGAGAGSPSAPADPTVSPEDAGAPPTGSTGTGPGADTGAPSSTVGTGSVATRPTSPVDVTPASAAGTLLSAGSDITFGGVTTDGFVVYSTGSDVIAQSFAGGTQTHFASDLSRVHVSGAGVFLSVPSRLLGSMPALDLWTNAHGVERIASRYLLNGPLAANADGSKVAFFAAGIGAAPPDLTLEGSDATGAQVIASACATSVELSASGNVITTGCDDTSGDLSVYAQPAFGETFVSSNERALVNPTGTSIWVVGEDGDAKLVRASDGVTLFSDKGVSGTARFDAAGGALFYTVGDALKVLATAGGKGETLLAEGCSSLLAVSPDGKQALVRIGTVDTLLSSVGLQELPVTSRGYEGYGFTSDSAFLLAHRDAIYAAFPVGDVSGAASLPYTSSLTPLAGSKVLTVRTTGEARIVDLSGADVAQELPGLTRFVVSADRSEVAYVSVGTAVPGLYAVSTVAAAAGTLH